MFGGFQGTRSQYQPRNYSFDTDDSISSSDNEHSEYDSDSDTSSESYNIAKPKDTSSYRRSNTINLTNKGPRSTNVSSPQHSAKQNTNVSSQTANKGGTNAKKVIVTESFYETYKGTQYDFADTSKMRDMWFKLLLDAAGADSGEDIEKIIFIKQLRRLQEFFPCHECKEHFGLYLNTHPPEEYIDDLFDYICDFMNDVYVRIGKKAYDKDILHQLVHHNPLTGTPICSKQCGIGQLHSVSGKERGKVDNKAPTDSDEGRFYTNRNQTSTTSRRKY